jgi:glycerol-3-phosphate cytidylyltransferase
LVLKKFFPGKRPNSNQKRVITFGTYDLLHEGHIKLLKRARALGDYLIVGVSTDALNALKGKSAMFSEEQRRVYVQALEYVDETFFEESLKQKDEYIKRHKADLVVMGDDWVGQFDWVSCDVEYLPRTADISSSDLKSKMLQSNTTRRILFGDTYIKKHYDCAMSMVDEMLDANIAPIFTQTRSLPRNLTVDCLVYFNKPAEDPPPEYNEVPRVCIDHGASNLKWFLASKDRFEFFDRIITAGPDHSRSILTFYPESGNHTRVHSAGFIKSPDLLSPPKYSRAEAAKLAELDPNKPITLFVPTWYIARNPDMQRSVDEVSKISNHVTILHPETRHIDASALNVIENSAGIVTEMMKHADCIISDLSSTIFEAAPLGKPVIQILMREYSDNGATLYDFPFVAATADLYCGGLFCRPEDLVQTVERVLGNPAELLPFFRACQQRILRGTVMNGDVANEITSELLIASKEKRITDKHENLDEIQQKGLEQVNSNLAHSRLSLIAHGGGDYNSHHASNSREAIRAALTTVGLVEIDVVKGKDGIFLAHNGFEERYGFDKPFEEVSTEEFATAKYNGHLTTLTLPEFFDLFKSLGGRVIFDIKNTDQEYDEIATIVHDQVISMGLEDRVIMQAYCKHDFETINLLGFKRAILALWKYYYLSPLGDEPIEFVEDCIAINEAMVWGISIPYYNHHMPAPSIDIPEIMRFYAFWKRIFIHGAPQERYPEILRLNMGVFADALNREIQFKDITGKFGWRRYLFLNPDLIKEGIDNQISAICHHHQWGQKEGRLEDYNLPEGFHWATYMDRNEDLRKSGVCAQDSAKSHWTRYGSQESRPY